MEKLSDGNTFRGWTALHVACENGASTELVSKLIEVGGSEILLQRDYFGMSALYVYFQSRHFSSGDLFILLVKEYISAQSGGEFEIGILFNTAPNIMQNQIYEKEWDQFSPSL